MEKQNIHLRAMEPEDLDFLFEIENDESLWEVGNTNVPYSRQVLLDYITSSTADIYTDKQVRFIIENSQHQAVGIIDLMNFDPRHQRAELGVVIRQEFRRHGLAASAILHLLDYARRVLHLHQVYAIVGIRNTKTVRMLESVGFQGDKILRQWLSVSGESDGGYEDAYFLQFFF